MRQSPLPKDRRLHQRDRVYLRRLKTLYQRHGHDLIMLACDETTMRLFPPLRAAWSPRGQQVQVKISGRNSKRVVFVALN